MFRELESKSHLDLTRTEPPLSTTSQCCRLFSGWEDGEVIHYLVSVCLAQLATELIPWPVESDTSG
jgi:hypothetical protein